jgi:hypothetical protein
LISLEGLGDFLVEGGVVKACAHLPANSEINVPLNYADYYFLEALLRYRALKEGKTRVSLGAAK